MGPRPTIPVNPSRGPARTHTLSSSTGRPPTPSHVSVGISPISIQWTPTCTFVLKGVSPTVLEESLPPSLAAWLNAISQMETIPSWDSLPLARAEAISVTDSENEDERPFPRFVTRARSPEVIPKTLPTDALVRP